MVLGPDHMVSIPCTVFCAEQGLDILEEVIFRARMGGLWKQTSSTSSEPGLGPGARPLLRAAVYTAVRGCFSWEPGSPDLADPT